MEIKKKRKSMRSEKEKTRERVAKKGEGCRAKVPRVGTGNIFGKHGGMLIDVFSSKFCELSSQFLDSVSLK